MKDRLFPRKVHKEPRFSVNKFGEYLTASAARRKKLIEEQKYPSSFITGSYKIARNAIIKYILKDYDESILDAAIEEIEWSDIEEPENSNSILVLKDVRNHTLPDLTGYKKIRFKTKETKMKIRGLDISICPDIVIKKGNKIGAIKIHVIKTNRLSKEAGQCVALLLHKYVGLHITDDDAVSDPRICFSLDCFGYSHETAPTSIVRRMENIEIACEEIVSRWDSL